MKRTFFRGAALSLALVALAAFGPAAALADSSASELPPSWHIHDGLGGTLGSQHKAIGFFPTILGISEDDYREDPARCPNATDKGFLPSAGQSSSEIFRAGVCMTSTAVISLRTVPETVAGPAGWESLLNTDGGNYTTYYRISYR